MYIGSSTDGLSHNIMGGVSQVLARLTRNRWMLVCELES